MDEKIELDETSIKRFILDGTPEDVVSRYAALPQVAAHLDFGLLDHNVVVLDTEATGFSFNHDELIQIAAARLEQSEIVEWYVTFVNPGKPLPEEIIHLTNIHESDVAEAPCPSDALAGLVDFVGDATVVAHNVEFDRTFVTKHPAGYPLLENLWIDSLDLARITLPRMRSHRLIDLVRAFGAPTSTHRADEDVRATCALYRILLAAVVSMPPSLVEAIAEVNSAEPWQTQNVFSYLIKNPPTLLSELPAQKGFKNVWYRVNKNTLNSSEDERAQSQKKVSHPTSTDDVETIQQKPPLFSLRALRAERVGSLPHFTSKVDAAELAGDPSRSLLFPDEEEINKAFSKQGLIGSIYGSYEPRKEQRAMAQAVNKAFSSSENLAVEAGTGVGKSMAYLIPAAFAAQNNNISIGIATQTNALLDQLVFQELPALKEALERTNPQSPALSFVALKGITHYPCLYRIEQLLHAGPELREVAGKKMNQAPALAALLSFIEQTDSGDMDALKINYRALPRSRVTTTSNDCLRRKCPYFSKLCYAHGARRRAEQADIVVTNHALFFCNLAAEGGLLPPIRYWIVDEAHNAEREARQAFTQTIRTDELMRLVKKVSPNAQGGNVFSRAKKHVDDSDARNVELFLRIEKKCQEAGDAFEKSAKVFVENLKNLLSFDTRKRSKGYDTFELWINEQVRQSTTFATLSTCAIAMMSTADRLILSCQEMVGYLETVEGATAVEREIASIALSLRDLRNAAEVIFKDSEKSYVYQALLNRKKDHRADILEACLLDVGKSLNETLYAYTHSVVFASATLTIQDQFRAFNDSVGLNQSEGSHAKSLQLDSSFDFDNRMVVYVVKDMPEPTAPSYLKTLSELLIKVHRAQGGSMLTLFTNRREMEKCYDEVQPALKEDDLRLVCQKWGLSVKGLRDDFIEDETLSLFALKSFWQGFDAPGATLRGVVIPKLPFARPSDPLSCERAARDDHAWHRYVLPQAVIETKQAAGRLIRTAHDAGVLILADKRLLTKRYGTTFLKSLQSKTVRVLTIDEITEALSMMSGRWSG